ncbi:hypothetical protein [Streptomyces sp. UNOC14_S4]|uniref:hypothetical protein n=1 Tax=Streptomyces sp. UNOC14_S4 TaxID=2872340 RepID=UPI001E3A8895|nr:hypothetical protein [Streptomyces sp. UNOC14_S4]MCC3767583.1 hypothetical protein [Streptomyces sp. UNOC14_S4]
MSDLIPFSDTSAAAPPTAKATAPVVHGAVIISAIETAWKEIRHRFPDVPDVCVTIPPSAGAQDPVQCSALRTGRHFTRDGHLAVELQVTASTLGLGGRPMLGGLLHHAAHGLALVRAIKDTCGDGRYHNKRYAQLAREVGLAPPSAPVRVLGLMHCILTDSEARRWAEIIAALDAAAAVQLNATVGSSGRPPGGGRGPTRFLIICACNPPRKIQIARGTFEQGPLLCGVCLTKFQPADTTVPVQRAESDA